MDFAELMSRTDAAELPIEIADELVTGVRRASTALSLGRQIPTTTRDSRIPVLTALPEAYWVGVGPDGVTSDAGLKQTTKATFAPQFLQAEEIAALCPIPDSVVADSQFDLWGAVKPLLVEACGRRVDDAVMWGNLRPSTWPLSMYEQAVAAGMAVEADLTDPSFDGPAAVLQAAGLVANMGYAPTAAAVSNGWQYRAAATRTPSLVANPIGADSPLPMLLGGLGIKTNPARWDSTKADAMVADWTSVVIGMRQDITLQSFNSGVISDSTGAIVMNALQQDVTIVRIVMRIGYMLALPPNDVTDSQGIAIGDRSTVAVVQQSTGVKEPVARRSGAVSPKRNS